jgi:hypothetical protein
MKEEQPGMAVWAVAIRAAPYTVKNISGLIQLGMAKLINWIMWSMYLLCCIITVVVKRKFAWNWLITKAMIEVDSANTAFSPVSKADAHYESVAFTSIADSVTMVTRHSDMKTNYPAWE